LQAKHNFVFYPQLALGVSGSTSVTPRGTRDLRLHCTDGQYCLCKRSGRPSSTPTCILRST